MTTLRTLSFDLDGTLAVGPLGRVLRDVSLAAAAGDPEEAARLHHAVFARHLVLLHAHDTRAYDWIALVREVFGAAGAVADDILRRFHAAVAGRGGVRFVNRTSANGLRRLRDASWRLVVATNGRAEYQLPVLRALGILDLFDRVVTSDRAHAVKPDPAFFRCVASAAAIWLHVGDRVDHDVVGARAAGASPVLLRAARTPAQEDDSDPEVGGDAWVAHDFDAVVEHVLSL